MATKIVTKNSSTASAVPTASDLVQGELAVNVADKRLFTEDNGGSVVELGTNPSSLTVSGNIDVDGVTNLDAVDIDGAVDMASTLQVDGAATFTTEITANGGIALGDNDKATFGDGDDLQIYHDGVSRIKELGAGGLYVDVTNDMYIRRGDTSVVMAEFNAGVAKLMFDGSQKLATTSTGIDVTGTATMDGLTVANTGTPTITIQDQDGTNQRAFLKHGAGNTTVTTQNGTSHGQFQVLSYNGTSTINRIDVSSGGDISFYEDTGTTAKLFWDASAESLGIGTSSPSAALQVESSTAQSGRSLRLAYDGSYYTEIAGKASGGVSYNSVNATAGGHRFEIDGSEKMRLDYAGNVGIGTTTPNYLLDVEGSGSLLRVNATSGNAIQQFSVADTTSLTGINFGDSGSTTVGQILYRHNGDSMAFSTANTEAMRIDSSGNVGIGTSPSQKLHVVGTSRPALFGSDNAVNIVKLYNSATGSGPYNGLDLLVNSTSNTQIKSYGMPLTFGTSASNGTDVAERMRIDSSGNLLVGTTDTSPHTNNTGTVDDNGIALSNAGRLSMARKGATVALLNRTDDDGEILNFRKNGTTVGSISVTSSATAYNTSSDGRLKENIADADDAGSKIDAIQVRKYDWKADGSHQDYGMIAQELQAVAPEAVSGDADSEDMMGVDYSKLVPMLIKEIQSLRNRVAQLEE